MRFAEQWSWCTVESISDVTPNIREFRLRPENGRVPPYPAGSHIGVTVLIDGQPARRSYSLVENGEGARAEAVMREHSRLAARNLRLAIRNRTHLELMPALALLKSSAE